MSSYDRDADAQRRARVACELDRREFWKECFKISLNSYQGCPIATASKDADAALTAFEDRFMKEIK